VHTRLARPGLQTLSQRMRLQTRRRGSPRETRPKDVIAEAKNRSPRERRPKPLPRLVRESEQGDPIRDV
jgi:hypothetical protein